MRQHDLPHIRASAVEDFGLRSSFYHDVALVEPHERRIEPLLARWADRFDRERMSGSEASLVGDVSTRRRARLTAAPSAKVKARGSEIPVGGDSFGLSRLRASESSHGWCDV